MFNIPRRTAKKFTESETNAARASGRFDSVDGVENQSRRGIYSGISRRQIALEKALAGSASRKTLKTSTMNLITTGSIMQEYPENHGLMFAFAKLCKTMTPFEALVQVSERVQRLEASQSRFYINTWNAACHWSYRSPVAVFEHVCKHASELAEKLLEKFLRFFFQCPRTYLILP